ncbi:large subunit ribosomal protein L48 [Paragonimus westermani]|uniref:Large subunit ribosomal protein L48 n=1 Tax=Paragonimus westermani TaxID=34504 RepID=A0A5J4NPT8_9TREM|nr:large subunit ribosomal protein L48 [Paragonimus westermani]
MNTLTERTLLIGSDGIYVSGELLSKNLLLGFLITYDTFQKNNRSIFRMDIRRSIFNLHAKYVFPIVHRALTRHVKIRSPDPPYLSAKPPIPVYSELQLDIKCRDFVVLERFCRYLERFVKHFNLEVYGFALPANRTTYRLYHPNSTKVRTEFELSDYIRIYRVSNMKAIHLPIFMDLLYQNLPEGVQLSVDQTNPDTDEARFVPQLEVHALQEELAKLSSG